MFFEDPFWVGVFQRIEGDKLSACKVTLGAEPRNCEVWDYLLKNHRQLKFSPPVDAPAIKPVGNPKRVQRALRKTAACSGVGTRSQQALQLQHEDGKLERKAARRAQRAREEPRRFELRQQKRKAKHRGR